MQTHNADIAHNLYLLYETLSVDIQKQFLQELFQKQADKLDLFELKELKQKSAKVVWQDFFENPQFPIEDFMNERVDLPLQEREFFLMCFPRYQVALGNGISNRDTVEAVFPCNAWNKKYIIEKYVKLS